MTKPTKKLLDLLVEEHRRLLALTEQLSAILSSESVRPDERTRFRQLLAQFLELKTAHGQKEVAELFPALEQALPQADHWQIKMLEIQEESILSEARHLYQWIVDNPASGSFERLREDGARMIRWMREHIKFEEERLFPRLPV
ncbi:MAG: hemerythrin domain-containing protein [Nitrospirae bacterium]|nr:hemerythrin domain-containing protein [Nitrospirota bacterium]